MEFSHTNKLIKWQYYTQYKTAKTVFNVLYPQAGERNNVLVSASRTEIRVHVNLH